MKKILIILILALIPYKSFCQNTNIVLTKEQAIEIYKGLKQNENLKEICNLLENQINDYKKINDLNELEIKFLNDEVALFKSIISDKNEFIENQSKLNEIQVAKIKDKGNKKFGFGPSFSYGFDSNFKPTFYLGVSLSYQIFRF